MERTALNDDMLEEVTGGSILPYHVQAGDSLETIARHYNVTVNQLKKWNNIQDEGALTVGQLLKIKY